MKKLQGKQKLEKVILKTNDGTIPIEAELWFPLFGLSPKIGPIADWGLEIEKNPSSLIHLTIKPTVQVYLRLAT